MRYSERFQPGDHVYTWRAYGKIQNAYQHHGIVIAVQDVAGRAGQQLKIFDLSRGKGAAAKQEDSSFTTKSHCEKDERCGKPKAGVSHEEASPSDGFVCVKSVPSEGWYKVQYGVRRIEFLLGSAGTCTTMDCDDTKVVLRRVEFLRANSNDIDEDNGTTSRCTLVPEYHVLFSNCECVAVWCMTGTWSTVQGSSLLGKAKAAVPIAAGAAVVGAFAFMVPAAGLWGFLGYSTPLAMAIPEVPVGIALVGFSGTGLLTHHGCQAKRYWSGKTVELNKAFDLYVARNM
ncbi:Pfam:NC [Seminavis robusta]|uniref:Pfam:NC n=1 Tax=Seminavis robusta TaxID=568900 RepID=A0A9N8E4W7_9STRA|nr:Pfam:NC [Seminavis robusta]|eukprot:Sro522_g159660.1 Pfam:NC (287) ;mRNA; r:54458-55318